MISRIRFLNDGNHMLNEWDEEFWCIGMKIVSNCKKKQSFSIGMDTSKCKQIELIIIKDFFTMKKLYGM